MGTQKKNVEMFDRINGWLHSIGPDGRYNRDRLFQSLGIPPGPDVDYGTQLWELFRRHRAVASVRSASQRATLRAVG